MYTVFVSCFEPVCLSLMHFVHLRTFLLSVLFAVLASDIWHKGRNTPSIRSPMMDIERMRPSDWSDWSVVCVTFSAFDTVSCVSDQ